MSPSARRPCSRAGRTSRCSSPTATARRSSAPSPRTAARASPATRRRPSSPPTRWEKGWIGSPAVVSFGGAKIIAYEGGPRAGIGLATLDDAGKATRISDQPVVTPRTVAVRLLARRHRSSRAIGGHRRARCSGFISPAAASGGEATKSSRCKRIPAPAKRLDRPRRDARPPAVRSLPGRPGVLARHQPSRLSRRVRGGDQIAAWRRGPARRSSSSPRTRRASILWPRSSRLRLNHWSSNEIV